MRFQELRFTDEAVCIKIKNIISLCQDLAANGPQELSTEDIESYIGQGKTGKILRQCLIKVKNSVAKSNTPATWTLNKRALNDLCETYKFFLGKPEERSVEDILIEHEKIVKEHQEGALLLTHSSTNNTALVAK